MGRRSSIAGAVELGRSQKAVAEERKCGGPFELDRLVDGKNQPVDQMQIENPTS